MITKIGPMFSASDFRDSCWAAAISGLLHVAFLALVLVHPAGANGFGGNKADTPSAGLAPVDSEFRQQIKVTPRQEFGDEQENSTQEQAAESALLPPKAEAPILIPTSSDRKLTESHRSPASPPHVELQTTDAPHLASSAVSANNSEGGQGNNDLRAAYIAALRTAILAILDEPNTDISGCVLTLQQKAGGVALSAQLGRCAVAPEIRDKLEAAALMAQPLPYAGYETVFSESLDLILSN